jgi:hypothetical protein
MNRYLYLEINLWQVGDVTYHDWTLAVAAAQRERKEVVQLYKKIYNPEWKESKESGND